MTPTLFGAYVPFVVVVVTVTSRQSAFGGTGGPLGAPASPLSPAEGGAPASGALASGPPFAGALASIPRGGDEAAASFPADASARGGSGQSSGLAVSCAAHPARHEAESAPRERKRRATCIVQPL